MRDHESKIWALVTMLAEAFQKPASEVTLKAYAMGLGDLTESAIQQGVTKAMRTCRFMPSVSELRELAGAAEAKPDDRVMLAWDCLMLALRKHTEYTTIRFDDGILNAAVWMLGGWIALNQVKTDDLQNIYFARFKSAYLALMRNPPPASKCGALVGVNAKNNGEWTEGCGYEPSPGAYLNLPIEIATSLPPLVTLPAPVEVKALPAPSVPMRALPAPSVPMRALPAHYETPVQVRELAMERIIKQVDEVSDEELESRRRKLLDALESNP